MNNSTESGRCRQNTARSAPRRTLQILKKVCGVFLCPDTERSKRPYQYFLCRASFLCENGQQYAGPLRRGLHPPHLHPHHSTTAESSGGDNGEFYGAGHVEQKKRPKSQAGKQNFLSGTDYRKILMLRSKGCSQREMERSKVASREKAKEVYEAADKTAVEVFYHGSVALRHSKNSLRPPLRVKSGCGLGIHYEKSSGPRYTPSIYAQRSGSMVHKGNADRLNAL